jgi:hypothetical protein
VLHQIQGHHNLHMPATFTIVARHGCIWHDTDDPTNDRERSLRRAAVCHWLSARSALTETKVLAVTSEVPDGWVPSNSYFPPAGCPTCTAAFTAPRTRPDARPGRDPVGSTTYSA